MSTNEQLTFFDTAPSKLSCLERFNAVKASAGFWPVSREEITRALTLIDYQTKLSGTAKHLNEVLLHQQKAAHADDPAAAVRHITRDFEAYWQDARLAAAYLRDLQEVIDRTSPSARLADVVSGVQYGVTQLVRFMDLRALADQDEISDDDFVDRFVGYTHNSANPAHVRHIADRLETTLARDAALLFPEAIQDQICRTQFWTEQLQGSLLHGAVRPIAAQALRSAGIEVIG